MCDLANALAVYNNQRYVGFVHEVPGGWSATYIHPTGWGELWNAPTRDDAVARVQSAAKADRGGQA